MGSRRRAGLAGLAATIALGAAATAAPASAAQPDPTIGPIQTVTHDNEKGWKTVDVNAETTFVTDSPGCAPAPPLGTGSLSLTVNPPDGHAGLDSVRYNRTYLRDLVALDYWECTVANNGQQTPFLNLRLDWNGDNRYDDTIVFEPAYQNPIDGGACGVLSGQARPVNGDWQHYDALYGTGGLRGNTCWWSYNDPAFRPGDVIQTLNEYIAAHPDAAIINVSPSDVGLSRSSTVPNVIGGVEVAMGDAGTAAQAYADAFHIGDRNPNSSLTYDFEPSP
jgi:hypothetical protein